MQVVTILPPQRMYKFGKTNSEDIMERFDIEVHLNRNWRNIPLAVDYTIKPLWSTWVLKEKANEAETWFKANYPLDFTPSVNYNGVGECRNWTPKESYAFTATLDKMYPKDQEYWNMIERLKAEDSLKGTHDKIYFIMLNRKQNQ